MDEHHYTLLFQKAAKKLNAALRAKTELEVSVGIYVDSVFLKLYKLSWANPSPDPLTVPSRIFFSVWVSDQSIGKQRISYNIHALKLRQLEGYRISSRDFAAAFRKEFKPIESAWPNVSTGFGPLTLMEGWIPLKAASIQKDISELGRKFLEIIPIIDKLLEQFKK